MKAQEFYGSLNSVMNSRSALISIVRSGLKKKKKKVNFKMLSHFKMFYTEYSSSPSTAAACDLVCFVVTI